MKRSPEEHKAYVEYMDENFDEEEDIIIPETFWGEIVYFYFIFKDMIETRKDIGKKWWLLKRQVAFFKRWQCLKYGIEVEDIIHPGKTSLYSVFMLIYVVCLDFLRTKLTILNKKYQIRRRIW